MIGMLIRIALGAAVGCVCKKIGDVLIAALLKKRNREYTEMKGEKLLLFVLMALAGSAIAALVPLSAELVFFFLLLIVCEAVAVIDAHTRLIPNDLVLSILGLSVLFGVPGLLGLDGWFAWKPIPALVGMAASFVIFMLPALLSRQVGAGDVKLAAAMGFCMGLSGSLVAIGLMGIFVLGYTLVQSKLPMMKFMLSTIPMGPFLSISMLTVLLLMKRPLVGELVACLPF